MAAVMKRLWNDPVWSKVIAQGIIWIILGIVALSALILAWLGIHFDWWAASLLAVALLLGGLGGLAGGFLIFRKQHQLPPNITKVGARIEIPDLNSRPLTFPLKCRVTMRNDSTECADIRFSDYANSNTIRSKKDLPAEVLQLRFRERWWPEPDGVDRISVLPHQQFRAWVGLDETMLSVDRATQLLLIGEIGTLVLSVNGMPVPIPLKP
jgi:hypothetical protein